VFSGEIFLCLQHIQGEFSQHQLQIGNCETYNAVELYKLYHRHRSVKM